MQNDSENGEEKPVRKTKDEESRIFALDQEAASSAIFSLSMTARFEVCERLLI